MQVSFLLDENIAAPLADKLDYTAHDEATMAALSEHVDGILWVTEKAGEVTSECNPASGRHTLPVRRHRSDE